MEKVVYLLGAGFSRPAGLPLIGDFYEKSKDIWNKDPANYRHFEEVFKTIDDISATKTYYEADLLNIEESLSILEMQDYADQSGLVEKFGKYIADVINYYTPQPQVPDPKKRGPYRDWIVGTDQPCQRYGCFVAGLFGFEVAFKDSKIERVDSLHSGNTEYAVVTLNYDTLLENMLRYFFLATDSTFSFRGKNGPERDAFGNRLVPLAKLHGSADGSVPIVPPTWNKTRHGPKVKEMWELAYRELSTANHIRIMGYSLPPSDSYVRYLLKSAAAKTPHLKTIDVICLDDDKGSMQKRYRSLITFKKHRFFNADIEYYLHFIYEQFSQRVKQNGVIFHGLLEEAHQDFVANRIDDEQDEESPVDERF